MVFQQVSGPVFFESGMCLKENQSEPSLTGRQSLTGGWRFYRWSRSGVHKQLLGVGCPCFFPLPPTCSDSLSYWQTFKEIGPIKEQETVLAGFLQKNGRPRGSSRPRCPPIRCSSWPPLALFRAVLAECLPVAGNLRASDLQWPLVGTWVRRFDGTRTPTVNPQL